MDLESKGRELTTDVALLQRLPETSPTNDAAAIPGAPDVTGTVTEEGTQCTRCVRS
ncbi:hypothetical protein [Nocardia arthritidis]|uniref:Uncharacterized protein n=1 Tax=Nocardia arthritidis TaxID=228602 RepID=A0A6G9YNU8_9NOCA|nr:hypothetical protein [Nocardia arthritidis]QIS14975.1 hypothetical protein F5544_35725 [Nocardia arthritidis]